MFNFKKVVILCLALVAFGGAAWSQSVAPTYYVSGGPNIYAVSNGTAIVIYTNAGSNFESLAIGPDWVDFDSSNFNNALHPFLLYACDTALNQVIRFAPAPNSTPRQIVMNNAGVTAPVCGRSSAAGDFYVSSKTTAGVWVFPGLASLPATGSPQFLGPIPVTGSTGTGMTGGGLTQKNIGDLLVVDQAQNSVLRFPYATAGFGPAPPSTFISSSLNVPVGIARFSNGDLFVANSVPTSGKNGVPQVAHFTGSGAAAGSCPALSFKGNQTPAFVASAENDLLYVVSTGSNASTVWTWSAAQGTCSLIAQATTPAVTGIAVPPVATATLSLPVTATVANPTPTTFFFNSSAFQLTASCPQGALVPVTAYPLSPATVATMIGLAPAASFPDGAEPSKNLGEGGYSVAYVAKWDDLGCAPAFTTPDGPYAMAIAGLFDNNIDNNTRILRCDGSANEPQVDNSTNHTTRCTSISTFGEYPLGGIIPQDLLTSGKTTSNSTFVMVNSLPVASTSAAAGHFCGYQTPLINTTDPTQAAVFSGGSKNTLSVKFKLAAAGGTCASGPYITTASALISVAQLTPSFNPIAIGSTSIGNADVTPLYNSGNQQYAFTLTIKNYAPGTYSLTTTFLTDNTTGTDIPKQTILFVIK